MELDSVSEDELAAMCACAEAVEKKQKPQPPVITTTIPGLSEKEKRDIAAILSATKTDAAKPHKKRLKRFDLHEHTDSDADSDYDGTKPPGSGEDESGEDDEYEDEGASEDDPDNLGSDKDYKEESTEESSPSESEAEETEEEEESTKKKKKKKSKKRKRCPFIDDEAGVGSDDEEEEEEEEEERPKRKRHKKAKEERRPKTSREKNSDSSVMAMPSSSETKVHPSLQARPPQRYEQSAAALVTAACVLAFVLSPDQERFIELALMGISIFVSGGAGTGKTEGLRRLMGKLGDRGAKTMLCSSTGNTAVAIGGQTVHYAFGMGLVTESDTLNKLVNRMRNNPMLYDTWKNIDILVIDEMPLLSCFFFQMLSDVLCVIRNCQKAFGGIQLVLIGDFFQLPPVTKKGETRKYVFQSKAWELLDPTFWELTTCFRHKDSSYAAVLSRVREGKQTATDIGMLKSRVGRGFEGPQFPPGIKPTELWTTNEEVNQSNERHLAEISTEYKRRTYCSVAGWRLQPGSYKEEIAKMAAESKKPTVHLETPEFNHLDNIHKKHFKDSIARLKKETRAPNELVLCKDAQVVLMANVNVSQGLANGSRGIVRGFKKDKNGNEFPVVDFIGAKDQPPIRTTVKHREWTTTHNKTKGEVFYCQIPLRLGWASTVHGAQGQTLNCVLTTIDNSNFEPGLGYTAMSRVPGFEHISFKTFDPKYLRVDPVVVEFIALLRAKTAAAMGKIMWPSSDSASAAVSPQSFKRPVSHVQR